jgi:hypothetical protein
MRRIGFIILAVCAVFAAGSAAGGLALAAARTVDDRFEPLQPAASPTPSYWVYLPLVARDSGVGTWTTVIEEGFEMTPGSLWTFWSFGGAFNWAARTCRPHSGSYSAWAVGGGASGNTLACLSSCPNDVDSWMAYGPLSLEDATAANLSFEHWINVGTAPDDGLWICASSDGDIYYCRQLTYQPTGWGPVTFPLDNNLTGVDMRGQPEVWIALEFVNVGTTPIPEGAYVDDFVIRKCAGGLCQTAASAGAEPAAAEMGKVQRVVIRPDRRLPAEQLLPK